MRHTHEPLVQNKTKAISSDPPLLGERDLSVYEHTSHPSNINTWPPIGLWLIHLK